jgi:hypothetical protein
MKFITEDHFVKTLEFYNYIQLTQVDMIGKLFINDKLKTLGLIKFGS